MSIRTCVSAAAFFSALLVLAAPSPAADDISGKWQASFGNTVYVMDLTVKGEEATGALVSPRTGSKYPIESGTYRDSTLKISVPTKKATVEAKLSGDRLEGNYTFGDRSGKFVATRGAGAAALVGKWRVTGTASGAGSREVKGTLEFAEKDGKLTGKLITDGGGAGELKSIKVEGNKMKFSADHNVEGTTLSYEAEGTIEGSEMKGTWKAADGSVSGEFKATKEAAPKAGPLAARYVVTAALPDGQSMRVTFEPKVEGEKLGGAIILRSGQKVAISSGSFRDGRLEAEADIPYEGQTARVKLTGTLGDKGVLKGSWSSDQGSGEWTGRQIEDI
jgi:hypothetical protein